MLQGFSVILSRARCVDLGFSDLQTALPTRYDHLCTIMTTTRGSPSRLGGGESAFGGLPKRRSILLSSILWLSLVLLRCTTGQFLPTSTIRRGVAG